ncbi:MAG: molecular chaperone TorD family protein [Humibacillus sp.]|nr:molecular chaperone TorD family protein [Humibacillus sp.]MDN5779884.1 molecular chaperone TorD family protein [Humibacillus sp.]
MSLIGQTQTTHQAQERTPPVRAGSALTDALTDTLTDNLADTLESHAAAWTVLSQLLGSIPADDVLDRVRDPQLLETWPLGLSDPATRRGLRLWARSRERGEAASTVEPDYRRVFHGPGRVPAPPYESVHVGVDGLVFDAETVAVRSFYRRFGLEVARVNRDPDDHVSPELELLATLAVRALDVIDELEAPSRDGDPAVPPLVVDLVQGIGAFLDDHVLAWVPRFGELLSEYAQTDFVAGLGHLLVGTLRQSADVFASPVTNP